MEEYRNKNGDRIGQTRYLHQFDKNRTQDLAYGMPSGLAGIGGKPRETAKDIMNGDYNENNGKSRTKSARELSSTVSLQLYYY